MPSLSGTEKKRSTETPLQLRTSQRLPLLIQFSFAKFLRQAAGPPFPWIVLSPVLSKNSAMQRSLLENPLPVSGSPRSLHHTAFQSRLHRSVARCLFLSQSRLSSFRSQTSPQKLPCPVCH